MHLFLIQLTILFECGICCYLFDIVLCDWIQLFSYENNKKNLLKRNISKITKCFFFRKSFSKKIKEADILWPKYVIIFIILNISSFQTFVFQCFLCEPERSVFICDTISWKKKYWIPKINSVLIVGRIEKKTGVTFKMHLPVLDRLKTLSEMGKINFSSFEWFSNSAEIFQCL